jgi:hypothetical protein
LLASAAIARVTLALAKPGLPCSAEVVTEVLFRRGVETAARNKMLRGSINHVSITVRDLGEAMKFFKPFLEFLGYQIGQDIQDPNGWRLTG